MGRQRSVFDGIENAEDIFAFGSKLTGYDLKCGLAVNQMQRIGHGAGVNSIRAVDAVAVGNWHRVV